MPVHALNRARAPPPSPPTRPSPRWRSSSCRPRPSPPSPRARPPRVRLPPRRAAPPPRRLHATLRPRHARGRLRLPAGPEPRPRSRPTPKILLLPRAVEEDDGEEVDESGVEPKDIELVMTQGGFKGCVGGGGRGFAPGGATPEARGVCGGRAGGWPRRSGAAAHALPPVRPRPPVAWPARPRRPTAPAPYPHSPPPPLPSPLPLRPYNHPPNPQNAPKLHQQPPSAAAGRSRRSRPAAGTSCQPLWS
jgi:hypothetical protein